MTDRRNLEELYRNMLDGELEALAAEAYALTEAARPLLRAEIAWRGLEFELRDSPAPAKPKAVPLTPGETLMSIGKVWDVAEARRVKEILDRINVTSYFGSDNIQEIDEASEHFNEAVLPEGLELKVKERQAEAAVLALRMAPPEPSEPELEEAFVVKCPSCGSEEVIFESIDEGDDSQFSWVCDACGHEWKDDGMSSPQ